MRKNAIQRSHRFRSAVAAALGLLVLSLFLSDARAAGFSEDAVKAAYLYRFAGYVDWPEPAAATPFIIDVLGAPGIAQELRRLLPGHPINGQVAQVREITGIRDLGHAQILYIAPGHADLVRTVLLRPGESSILLVTDEDGGLSTGSTLNFLTIDRNVRFEVSLTAAERSGLKISSELLGVAIRVQGRTSRSLLGCDVDAIYGPCGPRVADQGLRRKSSSPAPDG
jgi:hypothetical protein